MSTPTMNFGNPTYTLTKRLSGVGYADVVSATRAALAEEGFGVLTEIDVKSTLKEKLDVDFAPYVILGACNPPLAHQVLNMEPGVGGLLPCNVVVTEEGEGQVVVAAIDPAAMFKVVDNADVKPLVDEVRAKLQRVLERL